MSRAPPSSATATPLQQYNISLHTTNLKHTHTLIVYYDGTQSAAAPNNKYTTLPQTKNDHSHSQPFCYRKSQKETLAIAH
jgi:hypothetical protein